MATNENLPQTLVNNLIANGYTPRTPEEWIYSALDYLSQNTVSPPLGGGSGLNPDGSTVGATAQIQAFTNGVVVGAGTVGAPGLVVGASKGLYEVSATQLGISVAGALQAVISSTIGGIQVGTIGELVGAAGVTITGAGIKTDIGTMAAVGTWKIGNVQVSALGLVIDVNNYIEVEIDGTLVKIGIVI